MENVVEVKSFAFAVRIVKLCRIIADRNKEYVLSKQLLHETEYLTNKEFDSMEKDIKEIISILVSICKTRNKN